MPTTQMMESRSQMGCNDDCSTCCPCDWTWTHERYNNFRWLLVMMATIKWALILAILGACVCGACVTMICVTKHEKNQQPTGGRDSSIYAADSAGAGATTPPFL
jgi:hypothetical protein